MSVTVVTTVYGTHCRFFPRWFEAVQALDPAPNRVVVAHDFDFPEMGGGWRIAAHNYWHHPQAFYQQLALGVVKTDWVWFHDVDDLAMPDALAGLEDVDADVWQMGFRRSDGETYVPPALSNDEYLGLASNPYVGASCCRVDALRAVGGMRDLAFQDWDLWRRMAAAGAAFESSGRAHFHYMLHPYARTEVELRPETRARNVAEMMEARAAAVA